MKGARRAERHHALLALERRHAAAVPFLGQLFTRAQGQLVADGGRIFAFAAKMLRSFTAWQDRPRGDRVGFRRSRYGVSCRTVRGSVMFLPRRV